MVEIIIAEMMDGIGVERLASAGAVHYDPKLWQRPQELADRLKNAAALVVRNQTQVTEDLLARAPQLKVIGRLGVGLDNIQVAAAKRRGISVVTAQGANAVAVAEYVFACLLRFTRDLDAVNQSVRRGEWNRTLGGSELFGKTLGLIGLGDIGQRIALRARCFGMVVIAYDPWQLATRLASAELGVRLLPVEDVYQSSDFISVHVPLTEATRNLIDATAIARMKAGAYLINTARGGVVDEGALLHAIHQGRLGGAALDVRLQEPSGEDDPLAAEPKILRTPHIAGLTAEAGVRTAEMVADDVVRVLAGESPLASV